MSTSKIFLQDRALGYVSNEIPLVVRYINLRRENLIITCVGRAFHTYSSERFQLLSVSPQHEKDITCLAADSYLVYTSFDNQIFAWRRGVELKHTYNGHKASVKLLLPFAAHLISIDEKGTLIIWDVKTETIYKEIQLNIIPTSICHPPTYTNKVLIGSEEGKLQLWNIKTGLMVHEFEGWNNRVTSLEPAPAEDIIAIGLSNGKIILHNINYDISQITFLQDWGAVTSISFIIKRQLMLTGSPKGTVVVWSLTEGKVHSLIAKAHHGPICGLQCLPDELLCVTSSSDNCLKMWRFDMSDDSASLFKIREGHFKPPTLIRFHGENGESILSAGNDSSIRVFNTVTEIANKSFGRASYNRKLSKKRGNKWFDPLTMPPISMLTSETTRHTEWDSIVAIHRGIPIVTTWSFSKCKMGEHKLCHERFKKTRGHKTSATCVCLTHCGNFVVIGYSSGHIDKYNIQSGIHRGNYGNPIAHSYVRGVYVDSLNKIMISGGSDKFLKIWNFKKLNVVSKIHLDDMVSFFGWHRENSFLATALDNFDINIIDTATQTVVRKFTGHRGPVTDMTFSPDSRWLVTSAMDSTIRTWDIPTSSMVDILKVERPCISLTFCPTGNYLATAHIDCLGIYLWINKSLYGHVSLCPVTEENQITESLPLTGINQESIICSIDNETDKYVSKEQIGNMITLSGLENARWQNILNLDIVKKRNKPINSHLLKKPSVTPFFLPTIQSLDFQFDVESTIDKNDSSNELPQMLMQTVFAKQLMNAQTLSDYKSLFDQLKCMGPSALNYEIRCLSSETSENYILNAKFVELLKQISENNVDFELIQSYIGVLLKYNGRILAKIPEAINSLEHLSKQSRWEQLENDFSLCLSIVEYMKNN